MYVRKFCVCVEREGENCVLTVVRSYDDRIRGLSGPSPALLRDQSLAKQFLPHY